MGVENFPGIPSKQEGGFFDPLKLSEGKDESTLKWYRAAELKHGRVSMIAALGIWIQGLDTGIIPNPAFHETNALSALKKVSTENPGALIQIGIAIAALEVLGASIESKGDRAPGDFGWDPSNIRPKKAELLEDFQTKELKNGRLAMLGVAGSLYQTSLTGQGVFEQWAAGHIFPFGDGQGIF